MLSYAVMSRWVDRLFWLWVVVLSLPMAATGPGVGIAHGGWREAAKADLDMFGERLKEDAKATFFDGDNLAALGWAGLASVAKMSS